MKSIATFLDLLLLLASYGLLDLRHCSVEALDFITCSEERPGSSTLVPMGQTSGQAITIHKES
jgi:hypothetical protein